MPYIQTLREEQLKKDLPELRPGYTVRVYQKLREGNKERTQVFEGLVIARKHGAGPTATVTVRKVVDGVGVERIFPIHSPAIEKFEIAKEGKVRRAKLYYVRSRLDSQPRYRK